MDDTLVKSSYTWRTAEEKLYRILGSEFREDLAQRYRGLNAEGVGSTIYDALQPPGHTRDEVIRTMRDYLIEAFKTGARRMAGADEVLSRVSGRFRLAVASGSPPEAIRNVLATFGWERYFEVFVSSEEVERGKPAPDVFIEAASRLGVPIGRCLVIEDSLHGVRAAKSAGAICFAVPSVEDGRIAEESDRVFVNLLEIIAEDISAIG